MIVRSDGPCEIGSIVPGYFHRPGERHEVRFYILREATEAEWLASRDASYPPRICGPFTDERFYEISTD